MTELEYLLDWTEQYIRHKDLIARKLKSLKRENGRIVAEFKDSKRSFVCLPVLNNFLEESSEGLTIVTFNTQYNLSTLVSMWDKVSSYQNLCIIFINPLSTTEKRWMIFPHTHDKICDEESLESGLRSLFEGVDEITEDQTRKLGRSADSRTAS